MSEERMRVPYAGTMQLVDVGQGDAGQYACRAAGAGQIVTHTWNLTVQGGSTHPQWAPYMWT